MNNTTELDSLNCFELVGGPGCGEIVSLPENHSSESFEYQYERIDKKKVVHNFECIYIKGNVGDHRAYYMKGT